MVQRGIEPIIVRVTASAEIVEQATKLAREKLAENYSVEGAVLAVDAELQDIALSRAIVQFASADQQANDVEKPMAWISIFMSVAASLVFLACVAWLFQLVKPNSSFISVLLIVIGQGMLLNLFRGSLRYALYAYIDLKNENSFPTNQHPTRKANSSQSTLRLRRLRGLLKEAATEIAGGAKPMDVSAELAKVNLTAKASRVLTGWASVSAFFKDMLPPYENRWLAYGLALVFIVTCVLVIEFKNPAEGYTNYALAVSGWVAGDIARTTRRPRLPAS